MADPKYANLPGIAHDQPDVFETSDLPESEQHGTQDEDLAAAAADGDAVEKLHLSANEAFGKFKDKHLDAKNVDFSDKIRPAKSRKGYVSWSGDLELVNGGDDETPIQKFQRLKCEIGELAEEVEGMKKQKANNDDPSDLGQVASTISGLQEELNKLKLEEALGSELVANLQDPSGSASAKLLTQLDQLKQSRGPETKSGGGIDNQSDKNSATTYELLMKPETAKLEQQQKIAQFDKRLEAIEKVLGATPTAMSTLSVETSQKSILGAISVLDARTSLFEPSHLAHIEGRLAVLQQKMNDVAEKKQAREEQDKQSRISELYDLVQKSEGMSEALPKIVDRLDALQGLHDQALQFSKSLSQLDSVQQQLSDNLSTNQTLLRETQKRFQENLDNMQQNFKAMDDRLKKIGK